MNTKLTTNLARNMNGKWRYIVSKMATSPLNRPQPLFVDLKRGCIVNY
ncbi:MAG: hypothetical protein JW891_12005 [Candidatus Lokiarchaeota archaeon]|nr:hypothetical protein [Candidatus Lokiarchaeota archaeon]